MGRDNIRAHTFTENGAIPSQNNPEPPTSIPEFPGTLLSVGSTGANVRLVQETINKLVEVTQGLWSIAEDGIFGNRTRDAVMDFQRIFGLTVDGIVGIVTWSRLMEESYNTLPIPSSEIQEFPGTNLSVGASGANVRHVQQAINMIALCHSEWLLILTVDGQFGNMTRDAIFAFQSVFGMPITGDVNRATWDRLMQEVANVSANGCGCQETMSQIPTFPGTDLSVGASGSNLKLIQKAINTISPCHSGQLWTLLWTDSLET